MLDIKFLKNKYALLFFIYVVVLILFTACSYKIMFHDTWEYMGVAKKLAGFLNRDVFIVHSLMYSWFLSFFLKVFPSFLTMKVVNISWVILTGLLLYKSELKKTSFLVWVFSPIAWVVSPIISPVLPASFFLLVAYLSIKKWQENKKALHFWISALALGLSAALYDFVIILVVLFILSFFYNKKFKKVITYSLIVLLSFSLRLMLDASFFSLAVNNKLIPLPIYTLIRFWGAISVIQLGLHPMIPSSKLLFSTRLEFWNFLVIISPLLFYLYKINYSKHKNVIIFLASSTIILLLQGGGYIYFTLLAPIAIVLLSELFGRKELIIHIIVSFFLIIIMTYPYFIPDRQEVEKRNLIISDIKAVNNDFSFDAVVFDTKTLAMFYIWDKNLPYLVSRDEYNRILEGIDYYSQYIFKVESEFDMDRTLEVKAGLKTTVNKNIDYSNLPFLLEKGETPPKDYKLTKCYSLLCVYESTQSKLP